MRYVVYRWGFPCLDYLLDVSIRESIIWAHITSFVHTCVYRMFNVFIACLMYLSHVYLHLSSRHCFLCMFSNSDLSIYMYLLDFEFTVVRLISFMLLVIACTCMPKPHHLIMHTCDCLICTPFGFIICTRGVASDNLGSSCPDPRDRTLVTLL